MILPSSVSAEAHAYITACLETLARTEGVHILFAIESGSRAWGFPSADSDYDVRFVYARREADYLSVVEHRDVIETPTVDDPVLGVPLDLNGWDVRKALRLGLKSNPILHEWLHSPIRYGEDAADVARMDAFVSEAVDRDVYLYHYDRLARAAWTQMAGDTEVKVKRYCYALRPALMLNWLRVRRDLPPMDVASLVGGLMPDEPIISTMAALFAAKRDAGEHDLMPRSPALDRLIADSLGDKPPRPEQKPLVAEKIAAADALLVALFQRDLSWPN